MRVLVPAPPRLACLTADERERPPRGTTKRVAPGLSEGTATDAPDNPHFTREKSLGHPKPACVQPVHSPVWKLVKGALEGFWHWHWPTLAAPHLSPLHTLPTHPFFRRRGVPAAGARRPARAERAAAAAVRDARTGVLQALVQHPRRGQGPPRALRARGGAERDPRIERTTFRPTAARVLRSLLARIPHRGERTPICVQRCQ